MSQTQALQPEKEIVMTEMEAERYEERILTTNFFKVAWTVEDYPNHTKIAQYNHHEPHENCTGHLLIADIIGKPVYRRAISRLIARAPSMLTLLEKAWPIIEEEAERRAYEMHLSAPASPKNEFWTEMRELANEIQAEINKAHGREANTWTDTN